MIMKHRHARWLGLFAAVVLLAGGEMWADPFGRHTRAAFELGALPGVQTVELWRHQQGRAIASWSLFKDAETGQTCEQLFIHSRLVWRGPPGSSVTSCELQTPSGTQALTAVAKGRGVGIVRWQLTPDVARLRLRLLDGRTVDVPTMTAPGQTWRGAAAPLDDATVKETAAFDAAGRELWRRAGIGRGGTKISWAG